MVGRVSKVLHAQLVCCLSQILFGFAVSEEVETILSQKSGRSSNVGGVEVMGPLTSYELAMFTDLVVQISMIRCPKVSRPGMQSLKRFMFSSFSKAPQRAISHPLFYSNYRSLVECMNYAQDRFPKQFRSRNRAEGEDESFGRRRRRSTISEEFNGLIPVGEEGHDKFKSEDSFKDLFVALQGITEITCPSSFMPNKAFLEASLEEAASWVKSHDVAKSAHTKYFSKGGLTHGVNQCYQKLAF
ncbi:hypothetical protein Fcan01_03149 [Folsomia candida]|uniref:Uncharacterized protein n=1 Tax=Folsomia candida TaxID=158441 RepID=A0A226F0P5_FOLCA|nr:hypothetical protein Fcan01_03149 [Folsomia candida]